MTSGFVSMNIQNESCIMPRIDEKACTYRPSI